MEPKRKKTNLENFEEPNINYEILDFVELVDCILDYYQTTGHGSGDEWKRNIKEYQFIPEEIQDKIKTAFLKQLDKFT